MVLTELASHIESNNLATIGLNLFMGRMPDAPDTAVALYEYGGLKPVNTSDSRTPVYESPRVQVKVRDKSYENGRRWIQQIYLALHALTNICINETFYFAIFAIQQPFYLRRDANERVEFVCNFQVKRSPV